MAAEKDLVIAEGGGKKKLLLIGGGAALLPAGALVAGADDEADDAPPGLVREFFGFMVRDSLWWILAILVVTAIVATVIYFTAGRPEPFIYQIK